nr:hypothetical protein 10 [Piscirickettsiaceae bacterium]
MWDTLLDILLFVPRITYGWFVDALVYLVNAIPPPDFLTSLDFSGFSSGGMSFWIDFLALDWGFSIVFSALIARFIVRRIPFFG